jgi:RHS repeat-associated protein
MRIFNGSGIQIQTSQVGNIFGFTGREFDSESHLYYYRARYYDTKLGRFISADPIGFRGGDFNMYRYVSNNPVNYKDPTGLQSYGNANQCYKDALDTYWGCVEEANKLCQSSNYCLDLLTAEEANCENPTFLINPDGTPQNQSTEIP